MFLELVVECAYFLSRTVRLADCLLEVAGRFAQKIRGLRPVESP